jgi:hypothetical protein
MQKLDLTEWHIYEVEVSGNAVFKVDGVTVATLPAPEETRYRADLWIDNAVFYPPRGDAGAVYRHVTQEVRREACLEVEWVEIEGVR